MSQAKNSIVISVKTGATLAAAMKADNAAFRYTVVGLDGDGKLATPSNASTRPIGILQNIVEATNAMGRVCIAGTSKLKMAETCDEGEGLVADDGGLGTLEVADAADEYIIAVALDAAGATNDIIEGIVTVGAHSHASEA